MGIVILGGLKGPWTVVPQGEGHGYLGAIQHDEEEGKIQCHACGKWLRMINTMHLRSNRCNGIVSDGREYRAQYGFPMSASLDCPDLHEKRVELMVGRIRRGTVQTYRKGEQKTLESYRKAQQSKRENKESRTIGNPKNMLERNKRQICPAQLAHALRKMRDTLGRVPKEKEVPRKITGILKRDYGTYNKALTVLGIEMRRPSQNPPDYTDVELLDALRLFRQQRGREPMQSDAGHGVLPSHETYRRRLGSWSYAKKLAGVTDK